MYTKSNANANAKTPSRDVKGLYPKGTSTKPKAGGPDSVSDSMDPRKNTKLK